MKGFQKILEVLFSILKTLLTIMFCAMTAVITIQIVARYIFHKGWPWTDEMARYLNIYITFMAASLVMFQNDHIFVNFIDGFLPKSAMRWVNALRMLVVLCFSGFLLINSTVAINGGKSSVSSNMHLPMDKVNLIFPIAYTLLFIYTLFTFLCYVTNTPLANQKKSETDELLDTVAEEGFIEKGEEK